ncbi:MAG: hypothetical protein J6S85_09800 [Methanobrevibacter sp.]|nr:hypothetical protein [Methanobrevibacter sp.]
MKYTISKTVTRTYNLDNYENYKPSYTITVEYDEEESKRIDLQEETSKITQFLDDRLREEYQKLHKTI